MSATYKNLVDEALNILYSAAGNQQQVTSINGVNDTDVTFTVADATQISRGMIEVEDELMFVKSVDRTSNTVTLEAFGRGFRGTTAAAHGSGLMVTNAPLFPRSQVKAAIQETFQACTPSIYAVTTDETQTANAVVTTYEVPAATNFILKVEWQSVGPTQMWVPVRRWNYDSNADTTAFATGKSIDIFDSMVPGRTIKVTYAKDPTVLSADADTLAQVGLSEGMKDVLVYGACARLLLGPAAGRIQTSTVEQSNRDQVVAGSDPINTGKWFMQMHLTRLADEVAALQRLYPIRTRMAR